jgi:hypothetical protein
MRRSWLVLIGLVVAGLAIYSGLWFRAARLVRDGLPAWAEARRADGYALAWKSAAVEGFPLAFRLHLTGATAEATRPVPTTAASPELMLEAAPWNLHRWRFSAPQGATIAAPLDAAGLTAATLDGTVADRDSGTAISVSARTLAGTGLAEGVAAGALAVDFTLPPHPPASDADPLAGFSVQLDDATLPQEAPPLLRHIDAFSLAATMRGPLPAAPLDRALASWRDGGGTLDIDSAHLVWDKTTIDLDGTLALDPTMQPQGALTATVTGADEAVDAIVAAGMMEARYADFAKAVLRAIGNPDDAEGGAIRLPVTLQDRRIFVGPAPIAPLPQIDWR